MVIMALATSQDFLSMPQPPTSPDQEPWTENDTKAVQEARTSNPWEIILTVIPYRFPPVWPSTTHIIIHKIPFPSRYIVIRGTLPTLFVAKTLLTAEMESNFVDWQVMEALPQLMFKADAVIHIIGTPTKLMMGEGVPWQYETQ